MTDKELHKLKRQEVLQLLLVQVQEAEQLQRKLDQAKDLLREEVELCERLKERLDSKDEQIERLKRRLDDKDEQIHDLRTVLEEFQEEKLEGLEKAGSIAEEAMKMSGIFEAAQKAADIYLKGISQLCGRKKEDES